MNTNIITKGLIGLAFLLSFNAMAIVTNGETIETIAITIPKGASQSQIFESLAIQTRSESCNPPHHLNCAYYDKCRCELRSPHGIDGGR